MTPQTLPGSLARQRLPQASKILALPTPCRQGGALVNSWAGRNRRKTLGKQLLILSRTPCAASRADILDRPDGTGVMPCIAMMVSTRTPVGRPLPGRARSKDKAGMGEMRGPLVEPEQPGRMQRQLIKTCVCRRSGDAHVRSLLVV